MTYTQLQPGQQPTIGTMGQSVADLQQQLNAQHAGQPGWVPLVVDSKFGPKTQAAMNFKPLQTGQQQVPSPAPQQQSPTTLQGYTQGLQQMQSQGMQAYNDYKNLVDRINTGKIPLTPQQKVLLKGIEESFNSAAQQQETANKSLNQAVTQSGATSGLQRYNPAEAAAQVNLSVSQGIQKVNDIHTEMNMKIAEMKQQFQDNNLKAARDAYNDYLDLQKQQYSYMKDIYDTTYQYNKDLRDFNLRQQEFDLQAQKAGYAMKNGKLVPMADNTIAATNPRSLVASIFANKNIKRTQDLDNAAAVVSSAQELADAHKQGKFKGFGIFGGGLLPQFAISQEGIATRASVDALNGKVQQWLSGASLSKQQEKLVKSFIPDRNDTDATFRTKVNALTNYMLSDIAGRVATQGVNIDYQPVNFWQQQPTDTSSSIGKSVTTAIANGYEPSEVIDYLVSNNPDIASQIQEARSQGISDDDIVSYLAQQ